MNLKKGLFGYTKSSVDAYVASVKAEIKKAGNETEFKLFAVQEELARLKEERKNSNPAVGSDNSAVLAENTALSAENEKLRAELTLLRAELDKTKSALAAAELSASKSAGAAASVSESSLSSILLETQQFADSLKARAITEYNEKCAENEERLKSEKVRIGVYSAAIDNLRASMEETLRVFSSTLQKKKSELEGIGNPVLNDQNDVNVLRVSD